jgi:hypothetical protein
MAYVTISDPAIIDLAAWHTVINVVNQHSDSIAALTNNFGMSWSQVIDPLDATNWSSPFDFGTSMIQFGKAKISPDQISAETLNGVSIGVVEETINFNSSSFSSKPIVVATVATGSNASYYKEQSDINVSVISTSTSSCIVRAIYAGEQPAADYHTFWINWIAIGPK